MSLSVFVEAGGKNAITVSEVSSSLDYDQKSVMEQSRASIFVEVPSYNV
jgi:hypothetical protein